MSFIDDVGQLIWVGFEGQEAPQWLVEDVSSASVGAAVLFRRNLPIHDGSLDLEVLSERNAYLHSLAPADSPIWIAVDQEGGRVARVRQPATEWPPMLSLAKQSSALARTVGESMGLELAALGFDVDFAPIADVHTNPANPIIGDRAFATTPAEASTRALEFANGLAQANIIACAKHFPGHGDTALDSHLALPKLGHDMERLRSIELFPFERAIAGNVPMIMTAHVVFEAIDDTQPATLSAAVLTRLLRDEMGYEGIIVSDDLDMKAIVDHYGVADAACRAVAAGCDALLLCRDRQHQKIAARALIERAESDRELRRRIQESARRIRNIKSAMTVRQRPPLTVVGCPEHQALAARLRDAWLATAGEDSLA